MEKYSITIPKDDSSERWIEALEEFISMTEPEWLQGMKGASAKTIAAIKKCYDLNGDGKHLPVDYEIFLRRWGGNSYVSFPDKPICRFNTPLLYHEYFPIAAMEYYCEKWGAEHGMYQAFAVFVDEYGGGPILTFDDNNMNVWCRPIYPEHPIASDFRHCFCCSVFLDFGIRQFTQRIGFVVDRSPDSYGEAQTADIIALLKKQGFIKQWFSTELDQIWINSKVCCVISREESDELHVFLYYNDMKDCEDIVYLLRSANWIKYEFWGNFP